MIEQRKNQRFDLRLPIEILGGKSNRPKGETKNVSSCGVLFTIPATVQVGEPIEYVITLPKAQGTRLDVRLRCVGKVVRNDLPAAAFAATLERYEFVRGKI
jgi:hypothetical protein